MILSKLIDSLFTFISVLETEAFKNKLRNYSFTKRYYDWEQKEKWFGIQIYQSVAITTISGSFNIGFWFFSDKTESLHLRVYVTVDREAKYSFSKIILDSFLKIMDSGNSLLNTPRDADFPLGALVKFGKNSHCELIDKSQSFIRQIKSNLAV